MPSVALLALACGLACDTKPPDRDVALVESAISKQLDGPADGEHCSCSKWNENGSIRCNFVAGRHEIGRLIEAFSLRPYDEEAGRYLPSGADEDPLAWRADSCLVRSGSAVVAMESILLNYYPSEAWCELRFTPLAPGRTDSSARRAPGAQPADRAASPAENREPR